MTTRQLLRLYLSELRLFTREPQALAFVFAFPVITVLVMGGVFGTGADDEGFEFVNPQHYYTAAYYGVVLCAVGLIMIPVHLASYREAGVLRRFDTSGFPRWALPAVALATGLTFAAAGFVALTVTAHLAFGLPPIESPARMIAGLVLSSVAFVSLGVALGMTVRSARAAQGLGVLAFFPMFLLSGGGPPPAVMSPGMLAVSRWLPLTHVIRAIQEPWLGLGSGASDLAIVIGVLLASTAVWMARSHAVGRAA